MYSGYYWKSAEINIERTISGEENSFPSNKHSSHLSLFNQKVNDNSSSVPPGDYQEIILSIKSYIIHDRNMDYILRLIDSCMLWKIVCNLIRYVRQNPYTPLFLQLIEIQGKFVSILISTVLDLIATSQLEQLVMHYTYSNSPDCESLLKSEYNGVVQLMAFRESNTTKQPLSTIWEKSSNIMHGLQMDYLILEFSVMKGKISRQDFLKIYISLSITRM